MRNDRMNREKDMYIYIYVRVINLETCMMNQTNKYCMMRFANDQ